MGLFFKLQAFQSRVEKGEDEVEMLSELRAEILVLFQVHQPAMKALPDMGITVLLSSLGAIYSGGTAGEPPPNRTARRQRKKTPSSAPRPRKPATSR